MISQHPCLLVFCDSNLENKSSPASVMDWEHYFAGGRPACDGPYLAGIFVNTDFSC